MNVRGFISTFALVPPGKEGVGPVEPIGSLCIAGMMILLLAVTALVFYITRAIARRIREDLGTITGSHAQLDERSGEHIMMPVSAKRLAVSLVIFSAIPAIGLAYDLTEREDELTALDPLLIAVIVLVAACFAFLPIMVRGMKLRSTFRFDRNGIREHRDSAMLKSIEWRNVGTVSARAFRPIIIEWNGDKMAVPTSHTGVVDLLRVVAEIVPEARQIGVRKMIERIEKAQDKMGTLGLTQ